MLKLFTFVGQADALLMAIEQFKAEIVNQREKLTSFRNKSALNIDHLPGM